MADNHNRFGKYELQARLAAGGMAEIFKARYPVAAGISKSVVIKRILPHYAANKQFIQMFTNEARIVMGLSHGNIAQVFDFGEIDGDWFIAMEYVDGQPLSKVIKRARTIGIQAIPAPFAVLVSIEMLKGLHYAHTRLDDDGKPLKIVHRDVSPQNVLLSYEGQVKLVDFGIAKAKSLGREDTETGAVKGKYSYFSPEQARAKELDARTDVFSAGIVLYEMLCGQLPFQGKMIDTMSRIVKGQFAPPRALNPDMAPALEQIILTAMAHEKEKRYATADAFQSALSSYLYQSAPSGSASTLGSFVQLLFEPDLVAEGRPVQLQRELLDQVPAWKRPLPVSPTEETLTETAWGKDPSKSSSRKLPAVEPIEAPLTSDAIPKPMPRGLRYGLLAFGLGLLLGLGFAAHSVFKTSNTFFVELSSTPVGASIFVDGAQHPTKTPAVLELEAGSQHMLQLTHAGMRDWSRAVSKARGERLSMHAELEPLLDTAAPAAELDAGVAVLPAGEILLMVEAATHVVRIPDSKAARLKLNPLRRYRMWAEGRASLGGLTSPVWVTDVGYFLQGPKLSAKDSFGLVGKAPVTFSGATMVYGFLLDHAVEDNSGVIKVKLQMDRGAVQTLAVNAQTNALVLEPQQRLTVPGLSGLSTYTVKLTEKGSLPHTRGKPGGPLRKVMATQQADLKGEPVCTDALRVLEVGHADYPVRGTTYLWLTFPDDETSDNDGALQIEVTPGASVVGGSKAPGSGH